jgi:23S rRNA (cytidine1920-2'-O)/16S rRNA (cytidine1409-2'-O)-methyltransferase
LKRRRPLSDTASVEAITSGRVRVDGAVITNPNSMVRPNSSIVVEEDRPLRGELKLKPALRHFGVKVDGRIALDVGAAAGGFTKALLEAGARRVYAVDAGHGQLLGSLRQDPRVVNLESTNLAKLRTDLIPDELGVVTLDLSYLSLTEAVPQLGDVRIEAGADLIALVKPMFELGLPSAPSSRDQLGRALDLGREALERNGWKTIGWMDSPVRGAKGVPELLLHGRRVELGAL